MQEHNENNFSNGEQACGSKQCSYLPVCDVYERADAFVVLAELPGSDVEDVELKVEKGVLSISAHNGSEQPHGAARLREYKQGGYRRTLQLSDRVDADKIEATMKNGVLRIVLPKAAQAQARKIEVRQH